MKHKISISNEYIYQYENTGFEDKEFMYHSDVWLEIVFDKHVGGIFMAAVGNLAVVHGGILVLSC